MVNLQIIGAGYGRTGTKSLRDALNYLGTHHMENVILDPEQVPEIFENAYKHPDQPVDWERAYQGYNAAVDWPTSAFFDRLYPLCPNAKVILTIRDPDDWFNSVSKTIHEWPGVDSKWPQQVLRARKMARTVVRDGELGGEGLVERREELIQKFVNHIEHIKKVVKPENLLIMELGDGWEKLCKFLGKPIPQIPYPHSNKRDNFPQLLHNIRIQLTFKIN
ncbi:hypothetical protein G6F46_009427 [Rhizopus delemar]|uniref:Sulfotransferase domain-containing protein n=2 Tax=Rhizopus TaxID=4842 RepID=A0A9P6YV37_9FUNG|nr:hypothetical protein G6F55_010586 [Rhizopus delemar]KAG1536025.1 hypothetical protein G6F51_011199 [Rhizopus arrhizus]KAG1490311.1 hypothetical protein G6F54_010814 [Rhizopus delemar]KAG1502062.1 hypothetical protein G6F53_010942 [Rhizopus delemar]KAG1519471.1 hypothetical protein G6F52_008589 [Rhizopus delemar]